MAVLDVLTWPDPRLRAVARPVEVFDAGLRDFIADLEETMRAGPAAVGIAAPQVGDGRRVVIVDASSRRRSPCHGRLVLVNPEIVDWEGHEVGREGCLSVPDYTGNVIRARRIVVEALDERGGPQRYEMEGFEARVVQHEIDHLDGRLFLDRLVSRRNDLFRRGAGGTPAGK
ncbi:MAG TPA: peptide deformylase [Gammaproteobacteria bacterium]|nr:peptide deformylase [Gammaproteobacteria bacterium]